ncbi:MAG: hypothetical protein JRJ08_05885 [Deltaproteobacteria bacterium]|nr:hypothetical protein [Deltaproteobacteria bacterium]
MQRISIFIIMALVLIAFYYYKPLRNIIAPEEKTTKNLISDQKSLDKENVFDELRIELYALANRLANLQGKVQLLKIAQENRNWFKEEEYSQLLVLLKKAEEDLKQAELEYEEIKNKYARETVARMVKESLNQPEERRADSLEDKTLP